MLPTLLLHPAGQAQLPQTPVMTERRALAHACAWPAHAQGSRRYSGWQLADGAALARQARQRRMEQSRMTTTAAIATAMASAACSGRACRRDDGVESNADMDALLFAGAGAAARLTPSAAAAACEEAALLVCVGAAACTSQSGIVTGCKHLRGQAHQAYDCGAR